MFMACPNVKIYLRPFLKGYIIFLFFHMITLLAVTEAFCMEHPKDIYQLKNKE